MTLPPQFRSGDIIRMETTSGPLVARLIEPNDQNYMEVRWDWPVVGALSPESDDWLRDHPWED